MTKKIECRYVEAQEKSIRVKIQENTLDAVRDLSSAIFERARAVAL